MRAERLLSILMMLQRGQTLTAGELASRVGVSVRTIFRDIDALSGMGVPVYTESGRGGGIRSCGSAGAWRRSRKGWATH